MLEMLSRDLADAVHSCVTALEFPIGYSKTRVSTSFVPLVNLRLYLDMCQAIEAVPDHAFVCLIDQSEVQIRLKLCSEQGD
jgi:hypothetical protein